jgi:periplasmic copper chaperone A
MQRRSLLLAPLALIAARKALAHSYTLGPIEIGHPWARPSVTGKAAVFLALANEGRATDRLVGGSTPVAAETVICAPDGAALDEIMLLPHRPVPFRPGGRYIALRGVTAPLALGDSFPLTLRFATAGATTVKVLVEDAPDERG